MTQQFKESCPIRARRVLDGESVHQAIRRACDDETGEANSPATRVEELEENDPEYEIEKVTGSHWKNGEIHYLVRWKGYGPEDDLSIPLSKSSGFKKLIKKFHELNPSEP